MAIQSQSPALFGGGVNMNPTGATGTGGITPVNNPMQFPTGSPGNYGYGSSGNPNPISMNPVTNPTQGAGFAGTNWQSFGNELGKIYGKGVGSELYGFLDSGGGYNSAITSQAVEAQAAEMNRQAMTGYGNLESGLGEAGISPNSSVAALEGSNFWSNVTTAENAMTAEEFFNMWNSSMNREAGVLGEVIGDAAHHKQQQAGPLNFLSSFLPLGAGIGSSIGEGLSGGGGFSDVMSSLAGFFGA